MQPLPGTLRPDATPLAESPAAAETAVDAAIAVVQPEVMPPITEPVVQPIVAPVVAPVLAQPVHQAAEPLPSESVVAPVVKQAVLQAVEPVPEPVSEPVARALPEALALATVAAVPDVAATLEATNPALAPSSAPKELKESKPPKDQPASEPTLCLRGLGKRYGDTPVFENVSLSVWPGEFVAIVGESGVGKSTLLNCMAGLDHWDSGQVLLGGTDLATLDDTRRALLRRVEVGFVFQAFHVLPHLDVAQNIALPLMLLDDGLIQRDKLSAAQQVTGSGAFNAAQLGAAPAAPASNRRSGWRRHLQSWRRRTDWSADARVIAILDAVGLQGLGQRLPQELSGGQLQRVAIARALVHRPRLLLADEPTGNLDPSTATKVMDVLSHCAREYGTAVVLVTHSQASAARADRICSLSATGITEGRA